MAFNTRPLWNWLETVPAFTGPLAYRRAIKGVVVETPRTLSDGLTPTERAVLNAFAANANDHGRTCPSLKRVALQAGLGYQQALRVTKILRDLGVLNLRQKATQRDPAAYSIEMPDLPRVTGQRPTTGDRPKPCRPTTGDISDLPPVTDELQDLNLKRRRS